MIDTRFRDTYFSGAQCQILIGDSVVTEAVSVEGVLQIDQNPIYGYASKHFDAIASGRVIAMGSLTINYVFDGYLLAHIKKFREKENGSDYSESNNNAVLGKSDTLQKVDSLLYMPSDDMVGYYTGKYWGDQKPNPKDIKVRDEYKNTFNIKIRDFKVGAYQGEAKDFKESGDILYEEKILVNVALNKYSTIRRTDGGAVLESYSFIAQTFI